tara:strand:- start:6058 stop:6495 length:438 start_codon:yes stop_codon:yes gene_type:complete
MPPPVWLVPALIAAGTAISYYGSLQQQKQISRATRADKVAREERAKQLAVIAAEQGIRKLSAQRARAAAAGLAPLTGSTLLDMHKTVDEIETAKFFASKALEYDLKAIDTRGALAASQEAYQRGTNLLGGGASFFAAGKESGLFA